jgi:hypothetical protein
MNPVIFFLHNGVHFVICLKFNSVSNTKKNINISCNVDVMLDIKFSKLTLPYECEGISLTTFSLFSLDLLKSS